MLYIYYLIIIFLLTVDCQRCNISSGVGYLEDSCDCQWFYQCEITIGGRYIAHHIQCSQCSIWNADKLSCVRDYSKECITSSTHECVRV